MDSKSNRDIEEQNGDEFSIKSFEKLISTLPSVSSWGWGLPGGLFRYQGFCYNSKFVQGIWLAQQQFEAQPDDIILCSSPKTGTTWLKSLAFATITRGSFDEESTSPLLSKVPHDCVPFIEFDDHTKISTNRNLEIPVLATHVPYSSLPRSVIDLECKIVYICRDPKDTFVSLYHYVSKFLTSQNIQPLPLGEAFELFCEGKSVCGPYWDHVLGYWEASLEHPNKILFLKYEELSEDTVSYVEKLAEFMGNPFSSDEKEKGVPESIVNMCSFENLSNLEVNKNGKYRQIIDNKNFFRKGKVGDWENCLTSEMAARLDQVTMQKLSGSGLTL